MVPNATTFINKYTGETKQKCICGAKLPLHYNVHLGCEGKPEDWNDAEGINRTFENQN